MKRIAIHSAPRSGSSWLGNIFDSNEFVLYKFQPLFSYEIQNKLSESSDIEGINKFFNEMATTQGSFIDQEHRKLANQLPRFNKRKETTLCYKEVRYHNVLKNLLDKDRSIKVVGLVRHPCAVISSWFQAPKEFRKDLGWQEEDEWRHARKKNLDKATEFNGYEKWKEVTTIFLNLKKEYPDRFIFLRYRDLIHDPLKTVSDLFRTLDIPMTNQTISFINSSSSINDQFDAYSTYKLKNNDNAWKSHLKNEISREILNDLQGSELEQFI